MRYRQIDVQGAAERIAPYVRRTPVLHSASLDRLAGATLHLKAENLQRTGSFKPRGAFNAMLQMAPDDLTRGVVSVSSGNHAQAVALAARELGSRAVIVVPEDANPVKIAAARDLGAEIVTGGVTQENRERFVRELMAERGLPLIHPFDDDRVIAGQATIGLELLEDVDQPDVLLVPIGGGGLLAGVSAAVRDRWTTTRIIAVEPSGADDFHRSRQEGSRVRLDKAPTTICDGVRSLEVGERNWSILQETVDDSVVIEDTAVLETMELIWTRLRTVVEPSGALATAALLSGAVRADTAVAILSGGNVDLNAWAAQSRTTRRT
jgi:threo-3-hydroxy-L-aspartate ammonia-lyase